MPVHNNDIQTIFNKIADMLEIEGDNPFRVRAYRNAARTVGDLTQNVAEMVGRKEDLSKLPGIGKDLAGKIAEIVETGSLQQLEELEERLPPELNKLMRMESLGPKRTRALYKELNIANLEDLKKAAEADKIKEVPGFGAKTQEKILHELEHATNEEERIKLAAAEQIASSLVDYLKSWKGVKKITVAGSFRRRKETVGDLDILATCTRGSNVMERFVAYEDVANVISKGKTRSSVVLRSGLHVDLRVLPEVSYGAALHYFTGSKAHNIAVRKIGARRNLKINEYGVFKGGTDTRAAGRTEKEVFAEVGLPYIEPELREDRGEIEAAQQGRLPRLITLRDIRGDLHAHTNLTDGRHSLEDMAEAATQHGYEYLAVSEHSKRVSMARGLDERRLARRNEEIDRLNEKLDKIVLLKSIEVDILKDGSLDLPDSILEELDVTVCSVHYDTKLSKEKQTERIIRAMDNPYFHILGHPSGRLINERASYEVDMDRLLEAAKERGCFMEVNAHPDRLDLDDRYCKTASQMGVKVAISTDAHSTRDLGFMRFGVYQARRGWLQPSDVINTRSLKELKSLLSRK